MTKESAVYRFETPTAVDLRVELTAGVVRVTAEETAETTVELSPVHGDSQAEELIAAARVEQQGNRIIVLVPKARGGFFGRRAEVRVTILVPTGSSLRMETGSADVEARGRFGDAHVSSGSGDVDLEHIASGDLKTGSGDVRIARATGSLKVKSGSGDVETGPVDGDCDVTAGSGDVTVDATEGTLRAKTGSGDIGIGSTGTRVDALTGSGDLLVKRVERGEVVVRTGSGDIVIGVAEGTAAYLDVQSMSGEVTSSLDAAEAPEDGASTASVSAMTGTGDVVLQRA